MFPSQIISENAPGPHGPGASDEVGATWPGGAGGQGVAALDDCALEDAVIDLASQIAAATCRFLDLVLHVELRGIYESWGCPSVAHWLSLRCGMSLATAFEYRRIARALDDLPLIHRAFAHGELSYTKVRALTRVATPSNEHVLVDTAVYATGAQLDRIVAAFAGARQAGDPDLCRARRARRFLRWRYEPDGSLTGWFNLAPDAGAVLVSALEHAEEEMAADERGATSPGQDSPAEESATSGGPAYDARESPAGESAAHQSPAEDSSTPGGPAYDAEESPAGESPGHESAMEESPGQESPVDDADDPPGARRADALIHMAEASLARHGEGDLVSPRPSVVVHLENGSWVVDDGPQLSAHTARRLACDSTLIVTDNDQRSGGASPVDLGRRRRLVSPHLRRALQARDAGCRFPGCHRRRFTDAHHIRHWADGGTTDMDNLVLLCSFHHHRLHEGGCTLTRLGDGRLVFSNAAGVKIADAATPRSVSPGEESLVAANRAAGIEVAPRAVVPRGGGESYEMAWVVGAFCDFETLQAMKKATSPAPVTKSGEVTSPAMC